MPTRLATRHLASRLAPILALVCANPLISAQAAAHDSTLDARTALRLTIYQQDLALVSEQRQISLERGDNHLRWQGIASRLQADSVLLRQPSGQPLPLRELTYQPALLNSQNLLNHALGQDVMVLYSAPGQVERRESGRLLSTQGAPIVQFADRIEILDSPNAGRLAFLQLPSRLTTEPTLALRFNSQTAGTQRLELNYLTQGLSWQANYVMELMPDQRHLHLEAWASVHNDSGQHYTGARLQLMAGELARTVQPRAYKTMHLMSAPAAAPVEADNLPGRQSLADYHLYSLAQPVDLADQSVKQLALFQAQDVPVQLRYRLSGESQNYRLTSNRSGPQPQRIESLLEFTNSSPQLGQPLPQGNVRVYRRDADNQLQLIGENHLPATSKDGKISLQLGSAFDVTARREQLDFKRLDGGNNRLQVIETRQRIELHNAKAEAVSVSVEENLPGDWQIVESSLPHEKLNAQQAGWQVNIPANSRRTLEFRVRSTLNN